VRLGRSSTVPPAPQPLRYCPAPCHIPTGSGSGETETNEEHEEPDQDAEGYEDGRHWAPMYKRSPDGPLFLPASARSRPTQEAEGRRSVGDAVALSRFTRLDEGQDEDDDGKRDDVSQDAQQTVRKEGREEEGDFDEDGGGTVHPDSECSLRVGRTGAAPSKRLGRRAERECLRKSRGWLRPLATRSDLFRCR
jgi:hypothetical protein